MPDLLDVLPVLDEASRDRVIQPQDTPLLDRLVPDLGVLAVHAHHDVRHFGAAHDGSEHVSRSFISAEADLCVSTSVVNYYCL